MSVSLCLPYLYFSVSLSGSLSVCLPVCLTVCLAVCLFSCLSLCLSVPITILFLKKSMFRPPWKILPSTVFVTRVFLLHIPPHPLLSAQGRDTPGRNRFCVLFILLLLPDYFSITEKWHRGLLWGSCPLSFTVFILSYFFLILPLLILLVLHLIHEAFIRHIHSSSSLLISNIIFKHSSSSWFVYVRVD